MNCIVLVARSRGEGVYPQVSWPHRRLKLNQASWSFERLHLSCLRGDAEIPPVLQDHNAAESLPSAYLTL